jgi:hypothetical protein
MNKRKLQVSRTKTLATIHILDHEEHPDVLDLLQNLHLNKHKSITLHQVAKPLGC